MKIHVSSETKQVLDKFNTFDLERRSPDIEVKVGHLIKCYSQTFSSFPFKARFFKIVVEKYILLSKKLEFE